MRFNYRLAGERKQKTRRRDAGGPGVTVPPLPTTSQRSDDGNHSSQTENLRLALPAGRPAREPRKPASDKPPPPAASRKPGGAADSTCKPEPNNMRSPVGSGNH